MIEIIVFGIVIVVCYLYIVLDNNAADVRELESNLYDELVTLKTKVGVIKTIQSKTDKLENEINNINSRLKTLETPRTSCVASSSDSKYTKSEVDAKFEELYELLGIEKEDYLAEKEMSYADRIYNTYSEICGYPTKSTKEIKQRLVFKKKSKKK